MLILEQPVYYVYYNDFLDKFNDFSENKFIFIKLLEVIGRR